MVSSPRMTPRRIGILGYDGIQALDLVGPAETFAAAAAHCDERTESRYEVVIIGLTGRRFVSETGLTLCADALVDTRLELDTMLIPGGATMRSDAVAAQTAAFVARRAGSVRRVASVCTGIFGVAPTGLLDHRRVTTHWKFAEDLRRRHPRLRVESDAVFVKDGSFYSSAGISAGIDLSLALIEEDHGPRVALAVARDLVVYFKRPGGQNQFSEPLQFQFDAADRFSDLMAWLMGHLHQDLSIDEMAARVSLSPRQFTRAFTAAYGRTPAALVGELRLGEASRRLSAQRVAVATVAKSVGYASPDVFRRAFERRFGVTPRDYRSRFAIKRGR
jgi:transcriptional regulator GlxA family with amidase domain